MKFDTKTNWSTLIFKNFLSLLPIARLCQHSKGEVEREETALRSGTASHGTHLQRLQRYCRIFLVPRIFSRIEFARHLSLWLPHLKPVVQKKKSQRLYRKYACS